GRRRGGGGRRPWGRWAPPPCELTSVTVSACAALGAAVAGVAITKAGAISRAAAAKAIDNFLIVSSCRNDSRTTGHRALRSCDGLFVARNSEIQRKHSHDLLCS